MIMQALYMLWQMIRPTVCLCIRNC